jgi:hypothetical protein
MRFEVTAKCPLKTCRINIPWPKDKSPELYSIPCQVRRGRDALPVVILGVRQARDAKLKFLHEQTACRFPAAESRQ